MSKQTRKRRTPKSREEQLRRLNRSLIWIGAVLVAGSFAYELFAQPGFSLQRFLFLIGAAIVGLAVGRTIGKIMFISRE